jgi:hypothetical protein
MYRHRSAGIRFRKRYRIARMLPDTSASMSALLSDYTASPVRALAANLLSSRQGASLARRADENK